jgi:hypothetical protein
MEFCPMFQGTGTNFLTKACTYRGYEIESNFITGNSIIHIDENNIIVKNKDITNLNLRPSVYKLLDVLIITLTELNSYRNQNNNIQCSVTLSIRKLAELCNKSNKVSESAIINLKRQTKDDLVTLKSMNLEWTEKINNINTLFNLNIIDKYNIHYGKIEVIFSIDFVKYLTNSYVLYYPLSILKIDARNGNEYAIAKKLYIYAHMNRKKKNNDIISVKSLLYICPDIPTYDIVKDTGRQFDQRITTALSNALDNLCKTNIIKKWYYCNTKKNKLSDMQVDNLSYKTTLNLYIYFEVFERN